MTLLKKIDHALQDYDHQPVPAVKRKNALHLTLVMVGAAIAVPVFAFGATLGHQLGVEQSAKAIFLGSWLVGVLFLLTGTIGARTNLSTYMICRIAYGHFGARFVSLILAIAMLGWFGVTTRIFGVAVAEMLGRLYGLNVSDVLMGLVGGGLMMVTAVVGFRAIDKLSLLASPLLLGLLVWSLYEAVDLASWSAIQAYVPGGAFSTETGVSMIVGGFAVGSVVISDITRYARRPWDAWMMIILGVMLVSPCFIYLASLLGIATKAASFEGMMQALSWGVAALLVMVLGAWTTNDNNLYSSSLALSVTFDKIAKWRLAFLAGCVGTVVGSFGFLDNFIFWLGLIAVAIPPIAGVFVVDYYLVRREAYAGKATHALRWQALVSWLVGAFWGVCATPVVSGGFGLVALSSMVPVEALCVSAFMYGVLSVCFRR